MEGKKRISAERETQSPENGCIEDKTQNPENGCIEDKTQSPESEYAKDKTQSPKGGYAEEKTQSPKGGYAEEKMQSPESKYAEEKTQSPKGGFTQEKQQSRAVQMAARAHLSQNQVQKASLEICVKVQACSWFWQAEWVYFYYPLGKEVNLLPLAQQALERGMQIAFPRVEGNEMDFYQVSSLDGFREGSFHVMEPTGKHAIQEKSPLVLVPGVGFDLHGTRMGYGKGYYDRYFSRCPLCHKIGIAHSVQLVEQLPKDPFDVPMDAIVTEQDLYFFLPQDQALSIWM